MFILNEFERWYNDLSLYQEAINIITRIRENDPSRRVGGGRKNVVGAYPSKKMGVSIQFESHKLELAGVYLKEHDDNVIEYYDQPPTIKIKYKSLGEKVVAPFHTPDYFVIYKDKAGWEEWKTEEELKKLAQTSPNRYVFIDGQWRCPPGEEYAKQFGLHYWLKSDSEINWVLQRNIVFLEDYLLDEQRELSEDTVNIVLAYVKQAQGILLIDLINVPNITSDVIYYMIARRMVYVDLFNEFLAEPNDTYVYKDEASSLAMQALLKQQKTPTIRNNTVNIAAGAKINWDGQLWEILNIGETRIYLSSRNNCIDLLKDQFYYLLSEDQIKGVGEAESILSSKITNASEQLLAEANRRYEIIKPFLDGEVSAEVGSAEVTGRTIRNWIKNYKQAEMLYGAGYIGLIPNTNMRGNRTLRIPDETLSIINGFLDENENATDQSVLLLHGNLSILLEKEGIECPCVKTLRKIINSRPEYERIRKTKGNRAAYKREPFYFELRMTTPRHGEHIFEISHIDHTEVDLQLKYSDSGKSAGKAWLTILTDAFSRRVLACYLTFDPPSYRSDMMVIRECVKRYNRLPQILVTDGGSDFKSIYYESLLAFYSITKKQRPAHKARFGSVIERMFGTSTSEIIHNLEGNTKSMKDPRNVSSSFNPTKHAVWTLERLDGLLKGYFYDFYDQREHSTLNESPREVFERSMKISGSRPYRYIPYDEDFNIMTMPAAKVNKGNVKIDPQQGVKIGYINYRCKQFSQPSLNGAYVPARYDPFNMGLAYCYINGQWVKCYSDYYKVFENKTEKQIMIASEQIRDKKKKYATNGEARAKELALFFQSAEKTENELSLQQKRDNENPAFRVVNGYQEDIGEKEIQRSGDSDFNSKLDFSIGEDD